MTLEEAVGRATGRAVASLRRVGGGDINDAFAADFEDGARAFVKTRTDAPAGEYPAEAAALQWLAEPGGVGVPEVLGARDEPPRLLALEWLDQSAPGDEAVFGRGLATVHAVGAPSFGRDSPLRVGPLSVPNEPAESWADFYAERRLRPLLAPARDRGALSSSAAAAVERVCDRMADLAGPPEPPARLHGDLWSGNVLWSSGLPYLIDPLAYGGHREVDLAMLRLFGSPGPRFLAAYDEGLPLAPGHQDRVALYQLFPLLVHAVLFGGGYGASVDRAARRYVG
ncbi:MAG TPA: fructosamine kinase family protein [Solirubrobacteraceae bacterium]|nr:fructosamine kinase family protein [Solirubrobacteraceae bacterium]